MWGGLGDGGLFDGVGGGALAGGVEEGDGQAIDVGEFGDVVAGGAGKVGDDGAGLGEKLVGEGGFADVGGADDGDAGGVEEVVEGRVV